MSSLKQRLLLHLTLHICMRMQVTTIRSLSDSPDKLTRLNSQLGTSDDLLKRSLAVLPDVLSTLDPAAYTLGWLFILCVIPALAPCPSPPGARAVGGHRCTHPTRSARWARGTPARALSLVFTKSAECYVSGVGSLMSWSLGMRPAHVQSSSLVPAPTVAANSAPSSVAASQAVALSVTPFGLEPLKLVFVRLLQKDAPSRPRIVLTGGDGGWRERRDKVGEEAANPAIGYETFLALATHFVDRCTPQQLHVNPGKCDTTPPQPSPFALPTCACSSRRKHGRIAALARVSQRHMNS